MVSIVCLLANFPVQLYIINNVFYLLSKALYDGVQNAKTTLNLDIKAHVCISISVFVDLLS